jgi:hypothetical protein
VSPDERAPGAADPEGLTYPSLGGDPRRDSMAMTRVVVAVAALVLLVGSVAHLVPAVRAGLHHGTLGTWVATGLRCARKACTWSGKFVLPSGRVQVAKAQYIGALPAHIHAGSTLPALYPGGSGLVYPTTGSDQWISLVVATVIALLALYWASRRWITSYLRDRRAMPAGLTPTA